MNVVSSTITSHNEGMNNYEKYEKYKDKTDQEIVETERCYCSSNGECAYCLAFIRLMEGDE